MIDRVVKFLWHDSQTIWKTREIKKKRTFPVILSLCLTPDLSDSVPLQFAPKPKLVWVPVRSTKDALQKFPHLLSAHLSATFLPARPENPTTVVLQGKTPLILKMCRGRLHACQRFIMNTDSKD